MITIYIAALWTYENALGCQMANGNVDNGQQWTLHLNAHDSRTSSDTSCRTSQSYPKHRQNQNRKEGSSLGVFSYSPIDLTAVWSNHVDR